jgi:hypothetical protein
MKKLTLFVNENNFKMRLQSLNDGDALSATNDCTSIVEHFDVFPVALLRNGNVNDSSKCQTLRRRLAKNISLTNIHVAIDGNHLLAFDSSKSIMVCYDFINETLFAAPTGSGNYKKTKSSFVYNADAIKIFRTTVSVQFALTEFIDPREDEKILLRQQLAVSEKLNNEKNIMIEELQKIAAEYKELKADNAALHAENVKLRKAVHLLQSSKNVDSECVQDDNQIDERISVQSECQLMLVVDNTVQSVVDETDIAVYKSNLHEVARWIQELRTSRFTPEQIAEKSDEIQRGFQWFKDLPELEIQMPIVHMLKNHDKALNVVRSSIESLEQAS